MRSAFSYRFTRFDSPRGPILRPLLPVRLSYAGGWSLETHVLVDSVADYSMIPNDLAAALRISMKSLRADKTMGIGPEAVNVAWTEVLMSIGQGRDLLDIRLPVQIVLDGEGPFFPLLGRHPFFHEFDVSFRMGYTETKGKFVMAPVTHRKDARKYA